MSRRRPQTDADPGSDSFLDIVANMVGILIILVMVVGVQAKDAFVAQRTATASDAAPPEASDDASSETVKKAQEELDRAGREALALKSEVDDLAATADSVQRETQSRFELRGRLQEMAVAAEQVLKDQRAKLNDEQRAAFDARRQLQAARDELEDLSAARIAVENTAAPVVVLKHLPTPMAKTVFGEEEHFRLSGGRLAYVPLNALAEEMRRHVRLVKYKLKQSPQITEIVGPIGGFSLQYTLVRRQIAVGGGRDVRDVVDLAGFVLVPSGSDLGEPVDAALSPDSEFSRRLSQFDANTTTVTIWTYPDSFGDFRRVKDRLYELGYLTAGRPMPAGHPIGGAPNGSRSGAQ